MIVLKEMTENTVEEMKKVVTDLKFLHGKIGNGIYSEKADSLEKAYNFLEEFANCELAVPSNNDENHEKVEDGEDNLIHVDVHEFMKNLPLAEDTKQTLSVVLANIMTSVVREVVERCVEPLVNPDQLKDIMGVADVIIEQDKQAVTNAIYSLMQNDEKK